MCIKCCPDLCSANESNTWCSHNIENLFAACLVPFWSQHLLRNSSYYTSSRLKIPSRIKLSIVQSVTWHFIEAEAPWKFDKTAVEIHNTNALTERQRSKAIAAILNFCQRPSRGNVWKEVRAFDLWHRPHSAWRGVAHPFTGVPLFVCLPSHVLVCPPAILVALRHIFPLLVSPTPISLSFRPPRPIYLPSFPCALTKHKSRDG